MARAMGLKLGKAGRREGHHAWLTRTLSVEEWEKVVFSTGGVALGISSVIVILCMVEGMGLVFSSSFVLLLTIFSGVLAAVSLILSGRIRDENRKKTAKAIAIAAGVPVWYLLSGITFVLAIIL